jgi:hypothetical protein
VLRPAGYDAVSSLYAAATISDAALDLALLRVDILAPADLSPIRALVTRPNAVLRATCNNDGHRIINVYQYGTLVGQIHHDGRVLHLASHAA